MLDKITDQNYLNIIDNILENDEFKRLNNISHHGVTRLDHSLKVSYYSYKITKRLRLDYEVVAKAGLLHDFFLSNEKQTLKEKVKSFYVHPKYAKENALKYFRLTDIEKNIIESHMFPIYVKIPKYIESWIVSIIDKIIAIREFSSAFSMKVSYVTNIIVLVIMNNFK